MWKLFLAVKRLKKCFALEFSPKEGDKCEFHTSRGRLPGLKEDTLEEVKKDETGREGEEASQITNPISEEEESGKGGEGCRQINLMSSRINPDGCLFPFLSLENAGRDQMTTTREGYFSTGVVFTWGIQAFFLSWRALLQEGGGLKTTTRYK